MTCRQGPAAGMDSDGWVCGKMSYCKTHVTHIPYLLLLERHCRNGVSSYSGLETWKKSNSREGCDCARELKRCLANWSPNTHAAVELCQGSAASLLSRTKTVSWLLQEKERLLNASSLVEKNICSFAHLLFCYSTVILGPQRALPVARGRGARSPYQWGSV